MTRFLVALGLAAGILAAPLYTGTQEYAVIMPPDTVRYTPRAVAQLAPRLAACFGRPEAQVWTLRWYTTREHLGYTASGYVAGGRYYGRWRTIAMQAEYAEDVGLVDHEIRHDLADREGRHPSAVYDRPC